MRRSMGIKRAIYSTGRFNAPKTKARVTIPALGIAGAPIDAAIAKNTSNICSGNPRVIPTIFATTGVPS